MDRARDRAGRSYLLATAFLSGLSVMVLEMAAVRAMAPYFGASNYIWTNVIGVILASLAMGYFLGGRLADRHPRPGVLYGVILVGGLLALLLPLVIRGVSRWLLPAELGPEEGFQLVYLASLAGTMILFAPPTLVLGCVSPFAIKLLVVEDRVGGAAGRVFASSTVGSIVGTFGTTLYLIPSLGTRVTIAVAGGLLVLTALVGFLVHSKRRAAVSVAVLGILPGAGLVSTGSYAGRIKEAAGSVGIYEEIESAYQYMRVRDVTEFGEKVRMLQINEAESAYQSVMVEGSSLTQGRYYDYYAVLPLLLAAERTTERPSREKLDVLVIGVAAGTIPKMLHRFFSEGIDLRVTGVEIDPAVLELGHRHFGLPRDEDWLRLVVADGRVFLNSRPRAPLYDIIVIDAFAQEYYIPFHLATRECFAEARARLKDGGILAMNASGYGSNEPLLLGITSTLLTEFDHVYKVGVSGYPNYMLFARQGAPADVRSLLALPEWEDQDRRRLRGLAEYVGRSARRMDGGSGAPVGQVLTDDRCPVERFTDVTVRRESRAVLGE